MLDAMEAQVRERLGAVVYGVDDETLVGVVVAGLSCRGLTVALGETTTDGLIARALQEAEGGDRVLAATHAAAGGLALAEELSIPTGVSDEEMTSVIAAALRKTHHADLGLAIVEGRGESPLLYLALASAGGVDMRKRPSRGRSEYAARWTLHRALDMVRRWLMTAETAAPADAAR